MLMSTTALCSYCKKKWKNKETDINVEYNTDNFKIVFENKTISTTRKIHQRKKKISNAPNFFFCEHFVLL